VMIIPVNVLVPSDTLLPDNTLVPLTGVQQLPVVVND